MVLIFVYSIIDLGTPPRLKTQYNFFDIERYDIPGIDVSVDLIEHALFRP